MAFAIVYVHGIGNKPRLEALKHQWDTALFGRDLEDASHMAYWASLRYSQPLPDSNRDEPAGTFTPEAGALQPCLPAEDFVADALAEARGEAGQATALERAGVMDGQPGGAQLEDWLRDMTYAADALSAGESAATREVLPFPRVARNAALRGLAQRCFKDVYAYFFGGAKEAIRDTLRHALAEIDEPTVVVGHSLGSVIAYDVLREQERDVPLFVTIGSPLAVTEIQDQLAKPLEVPAGVAAWHNASDARDLVALDHTVRPEYAPTELTTDFLVINDSPNHHGAREYLQAAPVQDPILQLRDRLATV